MISFAKRNLTLYFRDKTAVFFSLLGALIVMFLYILFLKNMFLSDLTGVNGAENLISSWIFSGVIGIAGMTTTLAGFGIMINDKTSKVAKDFYVSPMNNKNIIGGYILSSMAIGIIMSILTFAISEIIIVISDGEMLTFIGIVQILGIIILNVFCSSLILYFIVSFFKTNSIFSTASIILGSLIGFLTGTYIPFGSLPSTAQFVIKLFPAAEACSLIKQVMMQNPISISFQNAPTTAINNFDFKMGVVFNFGKFTVTPFYSVLFLVFISILFLLLSVLRVSKNKF